MRTSRLVPPLLKLTTFALTWAAGAVLAQEPVPESAKERFQRMSREAEAKGLVEPFKGVTTDGKIVPGLFPLKSTGVSTEPVRIAAEAFIAALTEKERERTLFDVRDDE